MFIFEIFRRLGYITLAIYICLLLEVIYLKIKSAKILEMIVEMLNNPAN